MEKLIVLHKHWIAADTIKQVRLTEMGNEKLDSVPEEVDEFTKTYSSFLKLGIFYAMLYVVIEGYRKLEISDEEIDKLELLVHSAY